MPRDRHHLTSEGLPCGRYPADTGKGPRPRVPRRHPSASISQLPHVPRRPFSNSNGKTSTLFNRCSLRLVQRVLRLSFTTDAAQPPAGSSRRKLPIYCKRLSDHPIERKIGRDERLHRGTVLPTKPGVLDRLPERVCKSFHTPRRNEPACLS